MKQLKLKKIDRTKLLETKVSEKVQRKAAGVIFIPESKIEDVDTIVIDKLKKKRLTN